MYHSILIIRHNRLSFRVCICLFLFFIFSLSLFFFLKKRLLFTLGSYCSTCYFWEKGKRSVRGLMEREIPLCPSFTHNKKLYRIGIFTIVCDMVCSPFPHCEELISTPSHCCIQPQKWQCCQDVWNNWVIFLCIILQVAFYDVYALLWYPRIFTQIYFSMKPFPSPWSITMV